MDTDITHGQIYNVTEHPVTYHTTHDYKGEIKQPYPSQIESGRSDTFVHVSEKNTPAISSAAVVYRGKNRAGDEADFMLTWYNEWKGQSSSSPSVSKVYAEIREPGHFDDLRVWDIIYDNLQNQGHKYHVEWDKLSSNVTTDMGTTPKYEATLELKDDDAAA